MYGIQLHMNLIVMLFSKCTSSLCVLTRNRRVCLIKNGTEINDRPTSFSVVVGKCVLDSPVFESEVVRRVKKR